MRSLETLGLTLGALVLASSPVLADDTTPIQLTTPTTLAGAAASAQGSQVTVIQPNTGTVSETYTTWNSELFLGGAVVFGAGYGAAVVAASQSEREGMDRMYVPLVGPWLALNERGECPIERESCDNETTMKVLIVGDGILQAAGAFMMLDAVLFPKTVHRRIPATAFKVKPVRIGQTGRGLAYTGRF